MPVVVTKQHIVKLAKALSASSAELVHYSPVRGLKSIRPEHQGKGVDARTSGRDPGPPRHSFFYRKDTPPESQVVSAANSRYHVIFSGKLYDVGADPEGHYAKLKARSKKRRLNPGAVTRGEYLSEVKRAGYHGFYNSKSGEMSNVVALFYPRKVAKEVPVNQVLTKNKIASAALGGSAALALLANMVFTKPSPQQKTVVPVSQKQKTDHPEFMKDGAHPQDAFLRRIGQIESSGGLNVSHKGTKSRLHQGLRAIGTYGIMPVTAMDIARHATNPAVMAYRGKSALDMSAALQKDPDLAKEFAREHASRLHRIFSGDEQKMAYAWNKGIESARNKNREQIDSHFYVRRFNSLGPVASNHRGGKIGS